MKINNIYFSIVIISIFVCLQMISSCSTGIESTKTISMSKGDRISLKSQPEDAVLSGISPIPFTEWNDGKQFLVVDNRISIVFESDTPIDAELKGNILKYDGFYSRITPGGASEVVLKFADGKRIYEYASGKNIETVRASFTSMDVPMLLDLDLVELSRLKLKGMKAWTRSGLWYDLNGEKFNGRKFVPVTITNVSPGNAAFQLKLDIADEIGNQAILYMNIRNSGLESRTFPDIFSISDPKLKYPAIRDEVWTLITRGQVALGMTKEECKLSLGNPDDVNSGHDWNQTLDFWRYSNGAFLQFTDGLLTKFRI